MKEKTNLEKMVEKGEIAQNVYQNSLIATFQLSSAASLNLGQFKNG